MENLNTPRNGQFEYAKAVNEKALMTYTFGWMFFALVMSTVISLAFTYIPSLDALLWNSDGFTRKPTILLYVAIFSPLAISLALNFGLHRMSFRTLFILFMAYAALIGISFSTIFLVYKLDAIINVFLSTCGLFGLMALLGATTKTDLSKMGGILRMAVLGILVAMLVNIFMQSDFLDYIISIIGVIAFTGLAAYHTQNLKEISAQSDGSLAYKRLGIISAFMLYVTFINLFMFLLRLFGRRD